MYRIPPYPALVDPNIRVCERALTPEQVAYIRAIGDEYIEKHGTPGKVGFHEASTENHYKRKCKVGWLHMPSEDERLRIVYAMLGEIAQSANAEAWQYDLDGYYDLLQYLQYHGHPDQPGDHFGWHQDKGDGWRRPQRKLSFSVLLSEADEYEGGNFEIFDGEPRTARLHPAGTMYVFPSFVQHRVLPVTKGIRRSLVGWLCGPKFR